jgi:DNA polymerase-1
MENPNCLVTKSNFSTVLAELAREPFLALDTETTGLRPYHDDKIIGISFAGPKSEWYFNLNPEADHLLDVPDESVVMGPDEVHQLCVFLNFPQTKWFLANAKFDLHMLSEHLGVAVSGEIHDVLSAARVLRNDFRYDLDLCTKRAGIGEKSTAVEDYIMANDLWDWREIPGNKTRKKDLHFWLVPLPILASYAAHDARLTFDLGVKQIADLAAVDAHNPLKLPPIAPVWANEVRLVQTVFEMERDGALVDIEYCRDAASREEARIYASERRFQDLTGLPFADSFKTLMRAFEGIAVPGAKKAKLSDGSPRPCYDSDVLRGISHPAAAVVLEHRDAKSRLGFFNGFLYHADEHARIHPDYHPDGAKTGRFSCSNPNLQNLTKPDEDEPENDPYPVRRAFISPPGFFWAMFDYDQQEYRLMLDYAGARALIDRVLAGADVHQATADLVGIPRSLAKNANFAKLYGSGLARLAKTIGKTTAEAQAIVDAIDAAAPEVRILTRRATRTAEERGYVVNWLGRRCFFDDPRLCYRAANALIQGGAADVVKVAMPRVRELLKGRRSKLILNVHDELDCLVHDSEKDVLPKIKEIMETVYPYRYLPLTVSPSFSYKSLADKTDGYPS